MIIALVVLQILATLCLGVAVRYASKSFDIPITVHNLPIVLMGILLMVGAMVMSITMTTAYLIVGACATILLLAIADYSKGITSTVFTACMAVLLWSQLLIFTGFVVAHQDKMDL